VGDEYELPSANRGTTHIKKQQIEINHTQDGLGHKPAGQGKPSVGKMRKQMAQNKNHIITITRNQSRSG
jgi:hypothetical protein